MMSGDSIDDLMGSGADASSRFVDQLTIRSARVRHFLWNHRPFKARADLREANRDAEFLEKQVIRLHRSLLALEQHLAGLDDLSEEEMERREARKKARGDYHGQGKDWPGCLLDA